MYKQLLFVAIFNLILNYNCTKQELRNLKLINPT